MELVARIALGGALLAFLLGSAPFTPALLLAAIAIPIGGLTHFLGSRRLSATTLYWAISSFLYFDYRRAEAVTNPANEER